MKKFAKTIATITAIVLSLGICPALAAVYYDDVPKDSYYYNAIDWSYQNGITNGYDDGNFYPNSECTRAQAVTLLYRYALYMGYPTDLVNDTDFLFRDVNDNDYYYDAVRWAQWNGIIKGVGNNRFNPNGVCTRAQIVTMMHRLSDYYGVTDTTLSGADCLFFDVPASAYYFDAVCWAQWNEIVNGVGNNRFNPNGVCTRAQIVTMLYRFAENVG